MADAGHDEWELVSNSSGPIVAARGTPGPSMLSVPHDADDYNLIDKEEPSLEELDNHILVPPSPEGVLSTDGDSDSGKDAQRMDSVADHVIETTPVQSFMMTEGSSSFFLDQESLTKLLKSKVLDSQQDATAEDDHSPPASMISAAMSADICHVSTPDQMIPSIAVAAEQPSLQLPDVAYQQCKSPSASNAGITDAGITDQTQDDSPRVTVTILQASPAASLASDAPAETPAAGQQPATHVTIHLQGTEPVSPVMLMDPTEHEQPAAPPPAPANPVPHPPAAPAPSQTTVAPIAAPAAAAAAAGSSQASRTPRLTSSSATSRRSSRRASNSGSSSSSRATRPSRSSRTPPPSPSTAAPAAVPGYAQGSSPPARIRINVQSAAAANAAPARRAQGTSRAAVRQQGSRRGHGGLLQWLLPGCVMLVVALHHLATGGHEPRPQLPGSCHSCSEQLSADLWLSTAELSA